MKAMTWSDCPNSQGHMPPHVEHVGSRQLGLTSLRRAAVGQHQQPCRRCSNQSQPPFRLGTLSEWEVQP
jgi:hypothetical protein